MSDPAELKLVQTFLGASSRGAALGWKSGWRGFSFTAHTMLIRSVRGDSDCAPATSTTCCSRSGSCS